MFCEVVQLFVGVVINLELFHSRRSVVDVGGEFVEFTVRHERLLGSGRVNVQWVVDRKSASALREDTKT